MPGAIILLGFGIFTEITAQTITTFDALGAGTGFRQGTYALDIDPSGRIIGFVRGANDVRHGFIRSRDGSFTIFDARVRARQPAREREPTPQIQVGASRDTSLTH